MAEGVRQAGADPITLPLADGGEGTLWALHRTLGGSWLSVATVNPWARPITASMLHWPKTSTVVVELAEAAGWSTAYGRQRAALTASTFGVGVLVKAALDSGAARIVVGLGGSLTTDGGSGLLTALGARFLDRHGHELPPGGGALADLVRVDWSGLDPRLGAVELVALVDVDNPLTGPDGASRTFARQKGASPEEIELLEAALCRYREVVRQHRDVDGPGSGAAGGTGAALRLLGASLLPGSQAVLDMIGFQERLAESQALFTGEGRFDRQSLRGKAPAVALELARAKAVPSCLIVGKRAQELDLAGVASLVLDLASPDLPVGQVRRQIRSLLAERAREAVGQLLLTPA